MSWHKVRCFECSTRYSAEFCRMFYREYGSLEYCPRCGGDYLLGFSSRNDTINIK